MSDINTLIELKNKMESEQTAVAVNQAQIVNPSNEVESSLKNFIISRLERIESDAQFSDLIKMHIRQRLPEFSIDQLLALNDQITKSNNRSVEGVMPLFQGDSSGKIISEHFQNSTVASTAQNLYSTANGDMLQAVSYLGSVLSKLGSTTLVQNAEVVEDNSTN